MKRTSIIIPTFNGLRLLRQCLDSIRQYTDVPYELIVVDNGSTDGTADYCRQEQIPFISLPSNTGFPAACNRGLRMASGDALLLLNNDVVVSANWLSNLLAGLYSSDHIGIVGPIANYVSGKQQVAYPYADLAEFQRLAAEANRPDASKRKLAERIVGFCFLFKREVLDTIGLLDEHFSPGHYEDDDYCFRARMCGFSLMICGDALVHHEGSASFKEHAAGRVEELIERNYLLFQNKWGVDPHIYI